MSAKHIPDFFFFLDILERKEKGITDGGFHSRNARSLESGYESTDHGWQGDTGDDFTARRREGTQNTDLDA